MFGSTQELTMGYGASQTETQTGPKKQSDKKPETLLPVTVRMIEKAVSEKSAGEEVRFLGEEVGAILLVGAVEDLKKQQAAVEFVLNDASGKVRVRYFFQSGAADPRLDKLENGSYVKAIGTVKTEPTTLLSLVALHLVASPDDIAFHVIEVAHTALRISKKGLVGSTVNSSVQSGMQVEMSGTPSPKGKAPQNPELSTDLSPPKAQLQGSQLKDELQKYLQRQSVERPEGITLKVMVEQFNASAGASDVKASMDALLEDGLAYTTVDEEHFSAI